MTEKEHQLLGVDLRFIDQVGKASGLTLEPEHLDTKAGFSKDTENTFDSFAELMKAINKAETSPGDLNELDMVLLSASGYKIR